jgi:hypothetical protein
VPLNSYARFAAEDMLTQVVMERMLARLATRRHAWAAEPTGEAAGSQKSTSKSAVSRRFVRQTETALAELMARDRKQPASGRGFAGGKLVEEFVAEISFVLGEGCQQLRDSGAG